MRFISLGCCLALLSFVDACDSGTLLNGADADFSSDDPATDAPVDEVCAAIVCPGEQVCVDGRCMNVDPCADLVCSNPGEVCDPRDGACHPGAADDDGDTVTIGEGDCDDGNALVFPGAPERCDGVDQDCDLDVDEGFPDADDDGFDTCGFGNPEQADCDDAQATVAPGRAEACDGLDNDCDESVDEGIDQRPCTTDCGAGTERCEGGAWQCSAPVECDCTPAGREQEEPCGYCGTRTRTCREDMTWTEWSACSTGGVCTPGATETQGCGTCGLGTQTRSCGETCAWGAWGACSGGGDCDAGEFESRACGNCGTQVRPCLPSCTWGTWEGCIGEGPCLPPATESQGCGNCGSQSRSCTPTCVWDTWGACAGSGVCSPGAVESTGCGNCGTQSRTCSSSCAWGSWGTCTGSGVCSPGAVESQGCGWCGTQSRTCTGSCAWGSWSSCSGEGACSPGAVESTGCGNCGTQSRSCTGSCAWTSWGSCDGQGVCSPGAVETAGCNECGSQSRSCQAWCDWTSWSGCTPTYGCGTGYECTGSGQCTCGPYPHWAEGPYGCAPSCGAASGMIGVTLNCCPYYYYCEGQSYFPTWDCEQCCEYCW
jgi:hypothetical protein